MNQYHQQILATLNTISAPDSEGFGLKYMGTNKLSYHLNTRQHFDIAKNIIKSNPSRDQFVDLVTSLYQNGTTTTEILIAGILVIHQPKFRATLDPEILDTWLNHVHGWCETDTLCQMAFTADEVINKWDTWQRLLTKFTLDPNVHKRRASLVLLTKPVRQSADPRLSDLAFLNIDRLKSDKDILITKAVSWLLRSLITNHKSEVANYLKQNTDSLPKIAVREVSSKLATGKKYINQKKSLS